MTSFGFNDKWMIFLPLDLCIIFMNCFYKLSGFFFKKKHISECGIASRVYILLSLDDSRNVLRHGSFLNFLARNFEIWWIELRKDRSFIQTLHHCPTKQQPHHICIRTSTNKWMIKKSMEFEKLSKILLLFWKEIFSFWLLFFQTRKTLKRVLVSKWIHLPKSKYLSFFL